MKRKFIVFPILLLFVLTACAALKQSKDPFATATYQLLATSLSSYKIILDVFTVLRAQGQVSDEAWIQFSRNANAFLDWHKKADLAMADYKNGLASQGQVELITKGMTLALEGLKTYYQNQIPKEKQRPLIQ